MRVVVFGLGPRFKGGIANYTTSLAKALDQVQGVETHLVSWTQQYPAIVPRDFVDRSSRTDLLAGTNVRIHYLTNYNNPRSWQTTYREILRLKPDMVIFQWSIALQGLPLGYLAKRLHRHPEIEVIFDCHFVKQKEASRLDSWLTRMGIAHADTYIVHAYKTAEELKQLFPARRFTITETGKRSEDGSRTVIKLYHPVYDLFTPDPHFDLAAQKRELNLREHVFLCFGFIRRYKGVHNAIKAFAKVRAVRDDVSLLIVGESLWSTLDPGKLSTKLKFALFRLLSAIFTRKGESGLNYRPLELIAELGLEDSVTVVHRYVPNEEVHKYLQVSDCMLLFYLTATPSGVESLAYNFHLPILATRVGHFPESIVEGENGYLAEPDDVESMAQAMLRFLQHPIPKEKVARRARELSWENYARTILNR
ncbi:MAG: glycosyltransferase [Calditrichaeota bacterium]|nr:MAG: glycosyltransferase [Calditrichota bacterium]